MRRFLPLITLALAACGQPGEAPPVSGAWARLPAIPGRPGAAYFTLAGDPAHPRVLAGVESAAVQRIEMHEGGMSGGMMTMRPLAEVRTTDAPIRFAPGANHLMLFGIAREATSGGFLPLTFRFKDGTRYAAQAKIVAAGDAAPDPQ